MAGHSHWAGIKRQKEVADKRRGVVFSKLLAAITAAAKQEPNPDFNPRLRTAIEKARASSVPADNIIRAISRASESGGAMEELVFEAYGPGGIALLIEVTTDSRNRAVAEIKKLLSDHDGKWAEPGSVRWAFEAATAGAEPRWRAKFPQEVPDEAASALARLIQTLEEHSDVQYVFTNAADA
jgi:YebC/PmpR family DNA-binding regulatory protein